MQGEPSMDPELEGEAVGDVVRALDKMTFRYPEIYVYQSAQSR